MGSAAEILVIIISIVLSIFLIVGIVLGIYLIRLSAEIKKIVHSAQRTVDTVGDTLQNVSRITSPLFLARTITQFAKKITKIKKGKK